MPLFKFTVVDKDGNKQEQIFKMATANMKIAEMMCIRKCRKHGCQLFVEQITEEQAESLKINIQDDLSED